jgi:hypothetical protein
MYLFSQPQNQGGQHLLLPLSLMHMRPGDRETPGWAINAETNLGSMILFCVPRVSIFTSP